MFPWVLTTPPCSCSSSMWILQIPPIPRSLARPPFLLPVSASCAGAEPACPRVDQPSNWIPWQIVSCSGSPTATLAIMNLWLSITPLPPVPATAYMPANGKFNWPTRIVSFKMNNCGVVANPDFTLSASPNTLSITQGTCGSSTITVNPVNGFTGSVSLSASGLPSGVTASFNPASTTGTSTLTLSASSTATTGTSTVTITGVSGSLTHTTSIRLTVNAAGGGGPVQVNLSGAFNINPVIVTDATTFSGRRLDNECFC